jgi:hypothetical protein
VTLDGVVGSAIVRLELRYQDGTVVPVPITDRSSSSRSPGSGTEGRDSFSADTTAPAS